MNFSSNILLNNILLYTDMKNLLTTNDYNSLETVDYNRVIYDNLNELVYIQKPLYDFVDLGLSVDWATFNVGATKPEEYGLYFAWGETEGYSDVTDSKQFAWSDYKLCNGSSNTLTKYNNNDSYGEVDNLITLELSDDAAYVSDNTCRMPTSGECQELISNTTTAWTSVNGVNGVQLTSKLDGYTDKSIFIPAAGFVYDGSLRDVGSIGYIWSSSLSSGSPSNAHSMYSISIRVNIGNNDRYYGFSVRPVKEKWYIYRYIK